MSKNKNNKPNKFNKFDKRQNKPGKFTGNKKSFEGRYGDKYSSEEHGVANKETNNPEYYNNYPELTESAGKVSFAQLTGLPHKWYGEGVTYTSSGIDAFGLGNTVPGSSRGAYDVGIMNIHYIPTYGRADTEASAINISSQLEYSIVRHENSGSRNYEDPDLTQLNIAIDSAISTINVIRRVLNLTRTYSTVNRYWPQSILESMNIDLDEVVDKKEMYISRLNSAIAKLNSIAIPGNIDILARHAGLAKNLYIDTTNQKGTIIQFVPTAYYIYDWGYEGGGRMQCKAYSDKTGTWMERYLKALEEQLDAIFYNEDIGIMSGDIIKAFGSSVVKCPYVTSDESVEVVYDENMLQQIHNMITLPASVLRTVADSALASAFHVTQENGYLVCQPRIFIGAASTPTDAGRMDCGTNVIDMKPGKASALDVMYATRLMPQWHIETDVLDFNQGYLILDTFGSEVPTHVSLHYFSTQSGTGSSTDDTVTLMNTQIATDYSVEYVTSSSGSAAQAAFLLSDIAWAPRVSLWKSDNNTRDTTFIISAWLTENKATIDSANLAALHDAAVLSLWKIKG